MIKTVLRVVLILFVLAAGVYLVTERSEKPANAENTAATSEGAAGVVPIADEADQVLVYYSHGDQRCPPCLKIESLAKEAVQTWFAEELLEGRIVWQVVNYELPENAHFVPEFELYTKSLIVVKTVEGEMVEWENFPEIWELINDDAAFIEYVKGEVRAYLSLKEA